MSDPDYLTAIDNLTKSGYVFPMKCIERLSVYDYDIDIIERGCPEEVFCATNQNLGWTYSIECDGDGYKDKYDRKYYKDKVAMYEDLLPKPFKCELRMTTMEHNYCTDTTYEVHKTDDGDMYYWLFMNENQCVVSWVVIYTADETVLDVYITDEDRDIICRMNTWDEFIKIRMMEHTGLFYSDFKELFPGPYYKIFRKGEFDNGLNEKKIQIGYTNHFECTPMLFQQRKDLNRYCKFKHEMIADITIADNELIGISGCDAIRFTTFKLNFDNIRPVSELELWKDKQLNV